MFEGLGLEIAMKIVLMELALEEGLQPVFCEPFAVLLVGSATCVQVLQEVIFDLANPGGGVPSG